LKNNRLRGLYAITDSHSISADLFDLSIQQVLQGGARIIQYRDKSHDEKKRLSQANSLRKLCDRYDALLIINDDIDLALSTNADGVHLGKDDVSLTDARKKLGHRFIIGRSCYNNIDLAIEAEKDGANYIALGAIYKSPTKPEAPCITLDFIQYASTVLSVPICAIGGITTQNANAVIEAGVDMIAVISDLFSHDDIQARSKALSCMFR